MAALVAFDCDGTLVDSQHMIVACMQRAFAEHGLGEVPAERVRRIVGLSLPEAVARLLPGVSTDRHAAVVDGYRAAFAGLRADGSLEEPLFPDARAVLERLAGQGMSLAVCTGKSRRGLLGVLQRHGLSALFGSLQTADRHPGKPHPAMLLAAMAESGALPSETVLVGDTTYDVEMALNAGAQVVGVAWGYHPPAELLAAGAHALVHGFDEVPAAVAGLLAAADGSRAADRAGG